MSSAISFYRHNDHDISVYLYGRFVGSFRRSSLGWGAYIDDSCWREMQAISYAFEDFLESQLYPSH